MYRQNAAIIGGGFMGRTHSETLHRLGIPVIGFLGENLTESKKEAEILDIDNVYNDLEALLEDDEVDVVHICTPNYLHANMSKAALEAGKHVICEKPLATNMNDSSLLVKKAKEMELVAAVNYNLRYYPLCYEAKQLIGKGLLGDIRLIHGHYLQDWLFYPEDWNWRLDREQGGKSCAVADIGSHWFDMVSWLTGLEIKSLFADLHTIIPKRYKSQKIGETFTKSELDKGKVEIEVDNEDYATILMRFSNGAIGSVVISQISAGNKNDLEWQIDGSKASLRWSQENPNQMWIGHRDKPNEVLLKDPSLMTDTTKNLANFPGGHAEGYPDTFLNHFRIIYNYIDAGDIHAIRNFSTFEDGHNEVVLIETVLESNKEKRWINIG